MTTDHQQSTASATSTGESGAFFEQHVGAFYLSVLVVQGFVPVLKNCVLDEVHLQTGRMGWNTDDLLLVALDQANRKRQLAMQVKRQFTISDSNENSKKTLLDFWKDFRHNEDFDSKTDRLILVVLKGTQSLLHTFDSLLDCARASTSGIDFNERLNRPGFMSNKARSYAATVNTIIADAESDEPSQDDFRAFLSVLHVLNLDLNTATAHDEAIAKSLLAASATPTDPQAAAEETWGQLLQIVGSEAGGMPAAASYPYAKLPQEIRERHLPTADTGPVKSLREHSQITIDSIKTTIGDAISVDRAGLFNEVLDALSTSQAIIITSPAGLGKSALAKTLFIHLESEAHCIVFRAEELAEAHIDTTIKKANVTISAERLFTVLSTHGRNIVFVESIERLLEASVRDAFSDLLQLLKKFENSQLVMTCRDYSLATIQSSILEPIGVKHSVVEVPPLTDEELDMVAEKDVNIAKALANPRLRELLRSPYFLNKAAVMDWTDTTSATHFDERKFRQKCWGEVIRRDISTQNGINRRREQVFLEISLRRAKALRPYVSCEELDSEALNALIRDDLISVSPDSELLGAPSHDVLEDWAIMQWLDSEFATNQESPTQLAELISGYPALRRGYRKWLGERLICDPASVDGYVIDAFSDASLTPYFKDDTLICALQSAGADKFIARHLPKLLADNADLLVRIVHLLRVACKSTPHWLNVTAHVPSILLQPQGDAWKAILNVVADAIGELLPSHRSLILGLVEDWSKSIAWNNREPAGIEAAGVIVYALLDYLQGYGNSGDLTRAMQVLVKIPKSDPVKFCALVDRACERDRDDRVAKCFGEVLLPGLNSAFSCRDFPNEVVKLVKSTYLLTDDDVQAAKKDYPYSSPIDVDQYFGIRNDVSHGDFFPASAIRGPFRSLLRYHPVTGVELIIDLLNHAGSWLGEQKWPFDPLEKPWQISLRTKDGTELTQWSTARFWGMYRGLSVSPYFLQSAVMALEDWLLEICEWENVDAVGWFMHLLRNSNNVAITAAVSSACIAYPEKAGEAGITILSSRDLIQMDRSRIVSEHGGSSLSGMFPDFNVENKFYNEERNKSAGLKHRKTDLESLAIQMQLGSGREDVWSVIDAHRANLPSAESQTDEDRIWRLALHRMDVRGYAPVDYEGKRAEADEDRIYLGPGNIEPDVQAIVDDHAPRQAKQDAAATLFNWGYAVWTGKGIDEDAPSRWAEYLADAKSQQSDSELDFMRGGPGFVAAVCVRDQWNSMNEADRRWCLKKLIAELLQERDSDDLTIQVAQNAMRADRPAAYIMPKTLMEADEDDAKLVDLEAALANGLTHASTEIRAYAAAGIGQYLSTKGLPILLRCVGAIAMEARLTEEVLTDERSRPHDERQPQEEVYRGISPKVRSAMAARAIDYKYELLQLNIDDWPGRRAAKSILKIFAHTLELSDSIDFHLSIANYLVNALVKKGNDRRERRDYEFEYACRDHLANFAIRVDTDTAFRICKPIIDVAEQYPKGVSEFVQSLVAMADKTLEQTSFWPLWQAFSDQASSATWVGHLDSDRYSGRHLIDQLFLSAPWKEGVRHWSKLEGNAHRIDRLIESLPPSAYVIEAYSRFLHDIGEQSLPRAYIIIANRLTPAMELTSNCIYYLENILSGQVFGEPQKLKSDDSVQRAVISILDHLVDQGSSSAYRMRDDFVTPIAVS